MTPAIASVILSSIAILISLFGTLRLAVRNTQMQEWSYRQKVGDELSALMNLLTQSELLTQREQQRNAMMLREARRLLLQSADDPVVMTTIKAIEESKAAANEKIALHADLRKSLNALWQMDKPTADQLATVQKMKASTQQELTKLQDLERMREERYQNFMESAAKVS